MVSTTPHTPAERHVVEPTPLIVEDLMLLLLDDETGTMAGAGTMHYSLGGALLVELALRDRVEIIEGTEGLGGPKVIATGPQDLEDPLLRTAHEQIAQRTRRAQSVLLEIGAGLYKPVINRLIERDLIRTENKRVLGLFRTTRLPSNAPAHEADLRTKIRATLEDDQPADPRTGALIALLSASGTLPALRPPLPWSSKVAHRAKHIEAGNWAASAVTLAVATATAGAVAAAAVAATTAVVATS
ncbi:hypothetical protein Amir_4823 [Actinosynnema mirum DSM 43827]|uniref:Golgi phosphoprotein 3 n=1 Tax=Actinosynnema mirum (strain ATCC 29888 / DSM 43827 / JCM 3225 / NBRC 14064 / NCIMB 13271 / NRRL B-12336 / IMRU 3971 / 101) TaxID=446462 RepID=C6WPE8_ACTMD|nr:hypothetical protein Amir_4823 [Actinosynnema mirum DSM 43827]